VYARAAAHLVGLDRFTDADWTTLDEPFANLPERDEETDPPPPASPSPSASAAPVVPPAVVPMPGDAPSLAPRWRRPDYWGRRRS
jgi:hypothetical protein